MLSPTSQGSNMQSAHAASGNIQPWTMRPPGFKEHRSFVQVQELEQLADEFGRTRESYVEIAKILHRTFIVDSDTAELVGERVGQSFYERDTESGGSDMYYTLIRSLHSELLAFKATEEH